MEEADKKRIFHGIEITNDGILCGFTDMECIGKLWLGIDEIFKWILGSSQELDKKTDEYKAAIMAVQRFKNWDQNYNGNDHTKPIGENMLNEVLKPAVIYALNNGMPE